MKRMFVLVLILFLITLTLSAKGTVDKIIVTTPIGSTIEVTDSLTTTLLSIATLEVFPQSIPEPDILGAGYSLERQFKEGNSFRTFDRVIYYPAQDGGYVHYLGVENGWSEYDGKWFIASSESVQTMNRLILGDAVTISIFNVFCFLSHL